MSKWFGVALALAALLAGCDGSDSGGGGDGSTTTNSSIRLANGIANTALTLNAVGGSDGATFTTGSVAAGAVSNYVSASSQTYTVGVTASGGLTAATHSVAVSAQADYTLVAFPRSGSVNTFVLIDNVTTPATGFSVLAIGNASGDAGPLDVYLVAPGTSLTGVVPQFNAVAPRSTSAGRTLSAGVYDIVVTGVGKPGDVRLTLPSVVLASTKVIVLALTSTVGGGLVDGVLIEQGAAISLQPSNRSRVRVVGAFPPTGATNHIVSVTVGAASLGTLTAPSAGTYKLVHGGVTNYSVSVDGMSVGALPTATFLSGGDYTILVGGAAATPAVTVLTDNNQPSSSGFAQIRLINAAVEGGLTLYHNFLPINVEVPYGAASEYSPTAPASVSLLQITSPVAAFPGYTATNLNIAGSGVYTFFVLGSLGAPVVSLSKDR